MQFVLFEKLAGLEGVELYMLLAALLVAVLLIIAIARYRKNAPDAPVTQASRTKALVYGALCVSLSFILSYVKLVELPMVGSVTLCAMLPICLYGFRKIPMQPAKLSK